MSKSIAEQIANKCIHFNGIFLNECCKAGVRYDHVRFGRPYQFPCLNQGGYCPKVKFKSPEEVAAEVLAIHGDSLRALAGYATVKAHCQKTQEAAGQVPCECGGEIHYSVAPLNGHIRAKCSKCDISFME